MTEQLEREAAEAAEAARLEREEIRAWLAARELSEDYSDGPKFKPSAEAEAEAEARKAAGPVELTTRWRGRMFPAEAAAKPVPNPAKSWESIGRAEFSRLELSDMARESKAARRAAKAREAARRFRAEAVRGNAAFMLADMAEAELREAARKARASEALAAREALADMAAELGVPVAELVEALEIERLAADTDGELSARPEAAEVLDWPAEAEAAEAAKAARKAEAEAAREAARPRYTFADMAASEAAKAAREALAAIGPKAAAVVTTKPGGKITVAEVRKPPNVQAAERRINELVQPVAEARERLAEAELKVLAAKATKAVRPLKAAEAEADRIAAGLRKLVARLERAEAARDMAEALAAKPEAAGLISIPVASFAPAEAAREAARLDLPERLDRMPASFADRGPSVSWAASTSGATRVGGPAIGGPASDPTGDSAAALADGYRASVARAEAAEAKLDTRVRISREDYKARQQSEYRERRKMAARARRRAAKLRQK